MDEDISTEQKTWQVYNFGKRNVFRLDLNESRQGFCRRNKKPADGFCGRKATLQRNLLTASGSYTQPLVATHTASGSYTQPLVATHTACGSYTQPLVATHTASGSYTHSRRRVRDAECGHQGRPCVNTPGGGALLYHCRSWLHSWGLSLIHI